MGETDVRTVDYFADNKIFADMLNAYFFDGEQVIKSEELRESDGELNYAGGTKNKKTVRDNVKKYYKDTLLCIYVLEHQKHIDYHMVIRNMLAEAMEYHRQWKFVKKVHRERKDLEAGHEFVSGMKKTDRFVPVLSLIVYYGEDRWDAAGSLHELLEMEHVPSALRKYISDYQIHVFDYHDYENFDAFQTELKQVFSFIKWSKSRENLQKYIAEHQEDYYNISRETYELITTITNAKELLKLDDDKYEDETTGGINMCKGLKEWIEWEKEETTKTIVKNMLKRNMPIEDICALAECSQELVEEVAKEM